MPKRHSVYDMKEFCESSLWSEKQWSSSCSVWSKLAPTLCLHGGSCAVFLFSKSLPCPIESNEGIIDLFELTLTCYSTFTQQNVRKWEEHLEVYMPTSPSSSPERKMGRWGSWDGPSPFREHMCWYFWVTPEHICCCSLPRSPLPEADLKHKY